MSPGRHEQHDRGQWSISMQEVRLQPKVAGGSLDEFVSLFGQPHTSINYRAALSNIVINIMLSERTSSAGRLVLPQSRQAFTRRLEELQEQTRELFTKQTMRSSKRPVSTAANPLSSQQNRFLRSSVNHHRPMKELQQEIDESRPLTQAKPKRDNKSASPLSIIKTKQESSLNKWRMFKSSKQLRSNFLRKGSSIDRAILSNVLKSKLNANVTPSTFSYGDVPANSTLIKLIRQQIPLGMKDVVGAQEMMRMSHIMTGVRFQTLNLTQRLNSKLFEQRAATPHLSQDDTLTLKSIKRW